MQRRRKAREAALQVLYSLDANGGDADEALRRFWEIFDSTGEPEDVVFADRIKSFTSQLVHGAWRNRQTIDDMISGSSEHWSLGRMSRVDRSILRMAIYELLYCDDIPPKVSLNEAIDLGKIFGSENSGAFINGILDALYAEMVRQGKITAS